MTPPWGRPPADDEEWTDEEPPHRTVGVVVTHFEQPAELARTLHALARQTLPPDEVVVSDDGSAVPPTVPRGTRLVTQEDRGFRAAAARNHGAAQLGTDVVVFLDADTAPEPGLLAALTRLPRRQPDVLVVGRRRHADLAGLPVDAPVEVAGPAHELAEPAWLRSAYAASRDLRDADDLSCRFVISAVMACSRWWFEELGGFDEGFTAYGGEDWELAHRSRLAGGLLAHEPTAVAWHDGPDAGERPRGVKTAETAAIASRVGVPGLSPRGLLGLAGRATPVDRLLAPDASLDDRTLLLVCDAALAADPTAHLLLDDRQAEVLAGEPRVLRHHGDPLTVATASPARLLVELHRARQLDAEAWRGLLAGRHPGVATDHDAPVATTTELRLVRRARRWGTTPPAPPLAPAPGRPLPDDLSLEAWLGGW
ncbi:hypothetical protein ASG49_13975 [Marmoricola sp. Leaf446]|uniref:glycosyltransferase n=1 Tax=Marmoricola sp. Leaf446 TaxID=1736379 RepID=UPI0006F2A204|nr:glycosyltransferase [Marmoricola sp. Leaf446]KQT90837.1 hypothetical protein ASG49_13975 [Marmoricola sp. Leaf446]